MRKASDAEAAQMRNKQAEATIRKLTRRIGANRSTDAAYEHFLRACRVDVIKTL